MPSHALLMLPAAYVLSAEVGHCYVMRLTEMGP